MVGYCFPPKPNKKKQSMESVAQENEKSTFGSSKSIKKERLSGRTLRYHNLFF